MGFGEVEHRPSESFAREPILLHERDCELEKLIPREPVNDENNRERE